MLYREIEYAVKLGADRRQALLAVTCHAAQMTGTADCKGQIAPGYQADLIAVRDNPLTEPNALGDVVFVMKNGRIVRGSYD